MRAVDDAEWRDIAARARKAAKKRMTADADVLMHDAIAGDERLVLHDDVTGEQRATGDDGCCTDQAIVGDVCALHEVVAVANDRGAPDDGSAMHRHVLAKHVVVADLEKRL